MVQGRYQHPVLAQHRLSALLPPDLVSAVNHAYFLHLLATNPKHVVPSGKSLISIVTQEKLGDSRRDDRDPKAKLQQRVAQTMHAAFWDSVSCTYCSLRDLIVNSCQLDNGQAFIPHTLRAKYTYKATAPRYSGGHFPSASSGTSTLARSLSSPSAIHSSIIQFY